MAIVLDATSQALVALALEERNRTIQAAIAAADAVLDERLAPVRAQYSPDAPLALEPGPSGWQIPDAPATETKAPVKQPLKAARKRR